MPNLTLEDAEKEFPEECKALWELLDKEPYRGLYDKNLPGDLAWAALQWLAGKPISDETMRKFVAGKGSTHWYAWAEDMLRLLLEEVREQLKLETQK